MFDPSPKVRHPRVVPEPELGPSGRACGRGCAAPSWPTEHRGPRAKLVVEAPDCRRMSRLRQDSTKCPSKLRTTTAKEAYYIIVACNLQTTSPLNIFLHQVSGVPFFGMSRATDIYPVSKLSTPHGTQKCKGCFEKCAH